MKMGTVPMTGRSDVATRGFTLLEIALSMAILSVVALYTLQMYQSVSSSKKQADGLSKAEQISAACEVYFSGHEGLPAAGASFADSVPINDLGLGQEYRFDAYGRPFLYYVASSASGFQVDGMDAAGVIISLGENQLQDYATATTGTGTTYTTVGDDVLVPIQVNREAVAIALAELENLGKGVEAYQREYAGIQDDSGVGFYGDTSVAPPIIDPDDYDACYRGDDGCLRDGEWPQLYPYQPYYPTFSETGPPPSDADLAYDEPDRNWPPNDPSGANIYVNWPTRPPDPPTALDLPPGFVGWSGPNQDSWPSDAFGAYDNPPREETPDSYELIDEGGCNPGVADPSCVFAELDKLLDSIGTSGPIVHIVSKYDLGKRFEEDPWGRFYLWGGDLFNTDPRYHLFYSAGPDGDPGTDDDVILY